MTTLGLSCRNTLASATRDSKVSKRRRLGRFRLIRLTTPRILRGALRLGEPNLWTRRMRSRLAVGQIDDTDGISSTCEASQRPATSDLHVVGVSADCDQVEFGTLRISHGDLYLGNVQIRSAVDPIRSSPRSSFFAFGGSMEKPNQSSVSSCLVTAKRNVGADASNRRRSSCSIPRNRDVPDPNVARQSLERMVSVRKSLDRRDVDGDRAALAEPGKSGVQYQVDLPAGPPDENGLGLGKARQNLRGTSEHDPHVGNAEDFGIRLNQSDVGRFRLDGVNGPEMCQLGGLNRHRARASPDVPDDTGRADIELGQRDCANLGLRDQPRASEETGRRRRLDCRTTVGVQHGWRGRGRFGLRIKISTLSGSNFMSASSVSSA